MTITREQLTHGTTVQVKINGTMVKAEYVGWSEKYSMPLVDIGGRQLPRKVYGIEPGNAPRLSEPVSEAVQPVQPTAVLDVDTRFNYLATMVDMVATATPKSLIITGPGGLGKSFTVFARLVANSMEEDHDFVVIRGFSTAKALYRTMFENRDRIVVFDDCDSVLQSDVAVNLLKAALDTTGSHVSWSTERDDVNLPAKFEFTGKIIFISNRPLSKIPQALLSRALFVDLHMTASEKITRMRTIAPAVKPNVPMDHKHEVINLLDELKDSAKDLNFRTMLKVLDVRSAAPAQWREIARYLVTNGVTTE